MISAILALALASAHGPRTAAPRPQLTPVEQQSDGREYCRTMWAAVRSHERLQEVLETDPDVQALPTARQDVAKAAASLAELRRQLDQDCPHFR